MKFTREVRKLVGVPYSHQGRSCSGVDCVGLIYVAAYRLGITLDVPRHVDLKMSAEKGVQHLSASLDRKESILPESGDILLIEHPSWLHLCVYVGSGRIVTADNTQRRRVVERQLLEAEIPRIVGVFCLPTAD